MSWGCHRQGPRPATQRARPQVIPAGLRPVRAANGISLVQRQARRPVPPRLHQRRPARNSCRPNNTYVRLDQILPHLTALAILHAGCGEAQDGDAVPVTAPAEAAGPIDQLRASGVTLTYDPDTRSIRTGDSDGVAVTAGRDH